MNLCGCGCGQPAPIAKQTNARHGHVKGQPHVFARGHHGGMPLPLLPPEREFIFAIYERGDCYEWRGRRDRNGYGKFKMQWAHRVAYELAKGPIPDRLHIDHLCRHRWCVRPTHLEAVPRQINAYRARRTHCKRGHPFTEANSYPRPDKKGRQCWTCIRLRTQWYALHEEGASLKEPVA